MSVHLVHSGADGLSRLAPLRIADAQVAGGPPIAALGWRSMIWAGPHSVDAWHPAKDHGSVQMILGGALRIRVRAGAVRDVVGTAGDVFVFVDMQGSGHQAERIGDAPLQAINIRLSDDWDALRRAFLGWPDEALPVLRAAGPDQA